MDRYCHVAMLIALNINYTCHLLYFDAIYSDLVY